MIRKETDPSLINRLSNDEAVKATLPNLGGEIDWSPAFAPGADCVVLSNGEDAAQVYERTAERDWQVVTIFAPTCRGKRALEAAMDMRDYMLPHVDLVFGPVPDRLPQAKWFYRKLGGIPVDEVESGGHVYVANQGDTLFAFRATH